MLFLTVSSRRQSIAIPFRCRSYYFDEETGLYYLQTRYYDPELGRFISADSIEYLDPETVGGLNLYAYCGNNPIMAEDPTGTFGILLTLLICTIAGAAIGALVETGKQLVQNGWNFSELNWNDIGVKALLGAVTGLACGLGGVAGGMVKGTIAVIKGLTVMQSVGVLAGVAIATGFVGGVGAYALHNSAQDEPFDIGKAIAWGVGQSFKSALSFVTGFMMVGAGLWKVGVGLKNTFYNIVSRGIAKFLGNFVLNSVFDSFSIK